MRQRRYKAAWLIFLLLMAVILSGAWLYTNWKSSQMVLPPGLTINDQPMGGMTRAQALAAIEQAYTTPITVYYTSKLTLLLPEMVELALDVNATAENLDEALATQVDAQGFATYILDRILQREPETQKVNAVVTYSRERVDAFLERTAQKYDQPPQKPVPLPEAGTFRPPQDGTTLDIDASIPLLVKAILAASPAEREVHLIVDVEPAPEASLAVLEEAIRASLANFNGIAGLFAKDLRYGQELCINCNVAFSGLSLLHVPVAVDIYWMADAPLDNTIAAQLAAMLTESDAPAADALLAHIGASNPYNGALQVTDLLWLMGLKNTFIVAPYTPVESASLPEIVTPANERIDLTTAPDPARQTTPMEIGLIVEGLYQCTRGGGFLRALFPQDVTPDECQSILAALERAPGSTPLGMAMPEGIKIAHKQGWGGGTYTDLTLVYGTQTDFVLIVYLYEPGWLVWEESVPTFNTIGQLTYRFFNGDE